MMYFTIVRSINFDDLFSVNIIFDKEKKTRYAVSLYVIVSSNFKQG